MMKRNHRFAPPAFNPEKFLAQEKKKAATTKHTQHHGLFIPVSFSKEFAGALITRVSGDHPNAFFHESDHSKYATAAVIWKKEISDALTIYGIAPDPMLIMYLFAGVLSHPLYKKAIRKRKEPA